MGTPLNVTLSDDSEESTQIKEFILEACRRRNGVSRFPNLLKDYPSNIEVKFVIPKASNTATMSKPRAESDNTFMTILPPGAIIPVRVVRKKKDGSEGHPHAIATDLIPAKMTFGDQESSLLLVNPSVEREVKKWISLNLKVKETDIIEFYVHVNVCYLTIVLVGLQNATQRMVEPKHHTHTGRLLIPTESVMPCSFEYDFQIKTPFQIRIEDANCISWAQSKIRPDSSLNTHPQSGDLWFLMSPRKNFALMKNTPLQAVWEFSNVHQNHLTIAFNKDSISKLKKRFMDYNKTSDDYLPLFKFDIMWQGDYEAQRGLPPLHRPLFSFISQQLNVREESSKPVTQKKASGTKKYEASWTPKENKRNSRKSDDDRDDAETSTEDEAEVESGEESEKNDHITQTEIKKDPSQTNDTSSLLDQEFLNAYLNYRDILMRLFNYHPDSKTWANLLAVEKGINSRNDVYNQISEIIKLHYPEDQQSIMKPNIIKPYADRLKNIMNAKKAWHKWSEKNSA